MVILTLLLLRKSLKFAVKNHAGLSTLNYSVNYISLTVQHHYDNIHCLRGIGVELNNAFPDENLHSFAKLKT